MSNYQQRYGGYWRFNQLKDFCYLVNPFFPSTKMKDEMKASFDYLLSEYPSDQKVNNLLAGKYFGISSQYVCVGNGAAELIESLMNQVSGKIGIIYPTFEEYPNRLDEDKIISFIPSNNLFSYTEQDLIDYYSNKDISTLIVINPDNPSGNYLDEKQLKRLIEWAKLKGILLIVDESFVDFATNSISLLNNEILESNKHLIVIKSISKSYGVPGLRLGVLVSSDSQIIDKIRKDVPIWNINSFAEFYLQIFNKYESDYKKGCKLFEEERKNFLNELQQISWIRVIPSQANYFFCEITAKYTATELTQILLEDFNILIKDCSHKAIFENKNYIRIAIRDRLDNHQFIESIKQL